MKVIRETDDAGSGDARSTDPLAAPGGEVPPGGLADLAAKFDQVETGDAGQEGEGAAPGAEKPAVPNHVVLAGVFGAVRDTVCMVPTFFGQPGLEAPTRTLTDDKVEKLGVIWGQVLDQAGVQLSATMGRYGFVFVAIMASVPLLKETVIETAKEIRTRDGKPAALPAPGAAAAAAPVRPAANAAGYTEGAVRPAWGA